MKNPVDYEDFPNTHRLPKLAISAKVLLCLLMVAISEGTPVIRQVRLLNKGSSSWVNVDNIGVVSLKENQDGYEELRFISEKVGRVKIYAEKSKRWLCYNKNGKLVSKRNGTGDMCVFSEEMNENYYYIYRPIKDPLCLMGFRDSRNGYRPIRCQVKNQRPSGFYFFSKIDDGFNHDLISKHNEIISAPSEAERRNSGLSSTRVVAPAATAAEAESRESRRQQRLHRRRHRHGNRRRKFPNNNNTAAH